MATNVNVDSISSSIPPSTTAVQQTSAERVLDGEKSTTVNTDKMPYSDSNVEQENQVLKDGDHSLVPPAKKLKSNEKGNVPDVPYSLTASTTSEADPASASTTISNAPVAQPPKAPIPPILPPQQTRPTPTRRRAVNHKHMRVLTHEQRETLKHVGGDDLMRDMAFYMQYELGNSRENIKNVMNKVSMLVNGYGIRHQTSTKPGNVFRQGVCITLGHDFATMDIEANDWVHAHGGDVSHGWLIKLPLRKMWVYQVARFERGTPFLDPNLANSQEIMTYPFVGQRGRGRSRSRARARNKQSSSSSNSNKHHLQHHNILSNNNHTNDPSTFVFGSPNNYSNSNHNMMMSAGYDNYNPGADTAFRTALQREISMAARLQMSKNIPEFHKLTSDPNSNINITASSIISDLSGLNEKNGDNINSQDPLLSSTDNHKSTTKTMSFEVSNTAEV